MNLGLLSAPWSADPDRNASIDQAMWALSAGLLSGAGSGRNFAANLGNAITGATGAYNASQQDALRRKMIQSQLDERNAAAEERKQAAERQRRLEEISRSAYQPATPGTLGGGVTATGQQGLGLLGGMTRGTSPEDLAFDAALLASDNAVLNANAARQGGPVSPVTAPTAGGFDSRKFVDGLYGAGMPLEAMRVQKDMMAGAKPVVVGDALVDPATGREVYRNTKPMNVAPGGSVIDPATGRVVYQAPDRQQAPTEIEKLIAARNQFPVGSPERRLVEQRIEALNYRQPPASMTVSYGAPFVGVDPNTGQPMLYQPNNRGGAPQPTGLAPPPKPAEPPTEAERVAAGYTGRMLAAEQIMQRVGQAGYPSLVNEAIAEMPLTGGRLAPFARTPDQQLFRQAQEDWVRAKLRKESGAVIGEEEMAREIKTYFPQPNEPAELAAQKAQARRQAVAGMQGSAGRAPIPQAGGQQPQAFPMLPAAKEYAGKIATDRVSGKRYRSDGNKWTEIQ